MQVLLYTTIVVLCTTIAYAQDNPEIQLCSITNYDYLPEQFTLKVHAIDNGFIFSVNSAIDVTNAWDSCYQIGLSGIYTNAYNLSFYTNGLHQIYIKATDDVFNISNAISNFILDKIPPFITNETLSSSPPINKMSSVAITATDNMFIRSVAYQIDATNSTGWSNCVFLSNHQYKAVIDTTVHADGIHTLYIRAIDAAQTASIASNNFTIDNTPPQIAFVIPATNDITCKTIVITVTASDVQSGITETAYQLNGTNTGGWIPLYAGAGNTYTNSLDTTTKTNGMYCMYIRCIDAASNVGFYSNSFLIDNEVPTISIASPTNSQIVHGDLSVIVSADDNNTLDAVYYQLSSTVSDNWILMTHTSGSIFSNICNTAISNDGPINVFTVAVDKAGNSNIATVPIILDNTPPMQVVTLPTNHHYVKDSVFISITASDIHNVHSSYQLNATNAGQWLPLYHDTGNLYTNTANLSALSEGESVLYCRSTDDIMNTVITSVTLHIDKSPPVLTHVMPTNDAYISSYSTVSVDVSETGIIQDVAYCIDTTNASWHSMSVISNSVYAVSFSVIGITDGLHLMIIRAYDSVGNTSYITQNIIVNSTVPFLLPQSPGVGAFRKDIPIVTIATDDIALIEVSYQMNTTLPGGWVTLSDIGSNNYSNTLDSTSVSDGSNIIYYQAIDAADNIKQTNVAVIIDNSPPVFNSITPGGGSMHHSGLYITADVMDPYTAVQSIEYCVDAITNQKYVLSHSSGSQYTNMLNTATYSDGTHTVYFIAGDTLQNTNIQSNAYVFDNTPPNIQFIEPISNSAHRGIFNLRIDAQDDLLSIQSVEYQFDTMSGAWSSVPFLSGIRYGLSINSSSYSDGVHTIFARTFDTAGNSAISSNTIIIDNSPPSVSLIYPSTIAYYHGILIVKTSARDTASGIDTVRVRIDSGSWMNMPIQSGNQNSATNTNHLNTQLYPDGNHIIHIRVTDKVGLTAADARGVRFDNTPPVTTTISPSPGANVRGVITLAVDAHDALNGVTQVRYQINSTNGTWLTLPHTSGNRYQTTIDTTTLPEGAQTVYVHPYDGIGNITPHTISFTVDNVVPTGVINTPSAGEHVSGTVHVAAIVSDNGSISLVELSVATTNGPWIPMLNSGSLTFTNNFNSVLYPDGPTTLYVRAVDALSNSSLITQSVVIDNTPPTANIQAPTNNEIINAVYTLRVHAIDAHSSVSGVAYRISGGATNWIALSPVGGDIYEKPAPTSNFADGQHTLYIQSIDTLGHIEIISNRIVIDNTYPSLMTTLPAAWGDNNEDIIVLAEALDASGIAFVESSLNSPTGPWTMMTHMSGNSYRTTISGLGGTYITHSVYVRAHDSIGNIKTNVITIEGTRIGTLLGEFIADERTCGLWHFDGDATDYSSGHNHAIVVGSELIGIGAFYEAYRYDGSNDQLIINSIDQPIMNDYSLETWIIPYSLQHDFGIIGNHPDALNQQNAIITYYDSASDELVFIHRDNGSGEDVLRVNAAGLIATNTLSYLCFTRDTHKKMSIYINGVLAGSNTGTANAMTRDSDWHLGNYDTVTGMFFNGIIDETRISDSALSDNNIQLYWTTASNTIKEYEVGPPISIDASDGMYPDRVLLTWASVPKATKYQISRTTNTNTTAQVLTGFIPTTYYFDATAVPDVTYYYTIRSANSLRISTWSAPEEGSLLPSIVDYIYEPNDSLAQAREITNNRLLVEYIQTPTDQDFFWFTNSYAGTITVVLTNLPENYNMNVRDAAGTIIYSSERLSLEPEYISFTTTRIGKWYIHVYNVNGVFSSNRSYLLRYTAPTSPNPPATPLAPTVGLGADISHIQLSWLKSPDAEGYIIQRSLAQTGPWTNITGWISGQGYQDTTTYSGQTNYYRLIASNYYGISSPGPVNYGYKDLAPPDTIHATDGTYTNFIILSWSGSADVMHYDIYRTTNESYPYNKIVSNITETLFTNFAVTSGKVYFYKVIAHNNYITSGFSAADSGFLSGSDTFEVNDSIIQTYTTMRPGQKYNSYIYHVGDKDYYRVDIPYAGLIYIWLSNLPANYDLRLRKQNDISLAYSVSPGNTSEYIVAHIDSENTVLWVLVNSETGAWSDTVPYELTVIYPTNNLPAPAPHTFGGAALNDTSIEWHWDNLDIMATNCYIVDRNNYAQSPSLGRLATSYVESGLPPDQYINRQLVVESVYGKSYTPLTSVFTESELPTVLNVGKVYPYSVDLSWNGTYITGWRIERSNSSSTWTTIAEKMHAQGEHHYTDTSVTEQSAYWYRLRTYNQAGELSDSATPIVSVVTPSRVSLIDFGNDIFQIWNNYIDNPAETRILLFFDRPKNDVELSVKVFNLLGQEVAEIYSGTTFAMPQPIEWDTAGLPKGVYFIRVRMGDKTLIKKVINRVSP